MSRIPAAEVGRIPAAEVSRIPGAGMGRIPAAGIGRIPAEVCRIPAGGIGSWGQEVDQNDSSLKDDGQLTKIPTEIPYRLQRCAV